MFQVAIRIAGSFFFSERVCCQELCDITRSVDNFMMIVFVIGSFFFPLELGHCFFSLQKKVKFEIDWFC